jgi:predicted dithiol-disulfide oxidoreductase (DUF899 family)/pimeloyl-ACP methyl ester carboxylesterase
VHQWNVASAAMTTQSDQTGEAIVRVNGVDLCVQSFGHRADPAILLIAGAASSMLHWDERFCERLAAGPRFVIRYDQRDTGRSITYPPGEPGYTGRDLADDAIGVLDALGVARAHVVGISGGGGIAQSLAVRYPRGIESLTLAATSPIERAPDAAELPPPSARLAAGVAEPDWSDRSAVIEYLVAQELLYSSESRPVAEEYVRRLAERTVERANGIASINNHFVLESGEDAGEQRAAITAPTLVVHGTEDPLFPIEHGAALAAAIPGAKLLTLDQTGHELPPAVWDTVIPAILEHTARAARVRLLELEKEHTRRSDELARMRRELPWVPIEKPYVFDTDEGPKTLADLFAGRSQLVVYHFMFAPEWEAGCEGCSLVADHFDGGMVHLNQRDVTMVCVSRAPLEKINAYKRRMGWNFAWVSSRDSDFNYDFGVSFTPEQQANGAEYNFRWCDDPGDEGHGLSSFALDDGVVYHVYSSYARGTDVFNTFYQLLDRAPKGRDEDALLRGEGEWWWRRHDEYS